MRARAVVWTHGQEPTHVTLTGESVIFAWSDVVGLRELGTRRVSDDGDTIGSVIVVALRGLSPVLLLDDEGIARRWESECNQRDAASVQVSDPATAYRSRILQWLDVLDAFSSNARAQLAEPTNPDAG